MKKTAGMFLLAITTILEIAAAILYPMSAFSAEYGPFLPVEIIIVLMAVLSIATLVVAKKKATIALNYVGLGLCFLGMLALTLSFYTMFTPIGYVVSGLNAFSEILIWVIATGIMLAVVLLNIVSLFLPVVKYEK